MSERVRRGVDVSGRVRSQCTRDQGGGYRGLEASGGCREGTTGTRTQEDVAAAAGMSSTVLGEIERGDRSNFTGRTLAKLSTALGWSTDSIDRIINGEEPVEIPSDLPAGISYRQVPAPDAGEELLSLLGQLRETLGRLEDGVRRLVTKDHGRSA